SSAAAPTSSTPGSTPASSPPAAARAAGCTSPGTNRCRPNAAPGSSNPATSTRPPARPSPAGGTKTGQECRSPLAQSHPSAPPMASADRNKPNQAQTRLREKQYEVTVPVLMDRCHQQRVRHALEPEWEARFEPRSYGFRPGRSCQDAIAAIYNVCK